MVIKKVLCIDDDATTLLLMKMVIKKAAFAEEIITVSSGEEALTYYHDFAKSSLEEASEAPELIFLDLNMPMMSGWEFLDEFMETFYIQYNSTKVIVLSSSINPRDREKTKQYPIITDYISKPMTVDSLKNLFYAYEPV